MDRDRDAVRTVDEELRAYVSGGAVVADLVPAGVLAVLGNSAENRDRLAGKWDCSHSPKYDTIVSWKNQNGT